MATGRMVYEEATSLKRAYDLARLENRKLDSKRNLDLLANRLSRRRRLGRNRLAVFKESLQMAAQSVAGHRARLVERQTVGNDLRKCRKHHRETAVGLRLKVDRGVVRATRRLSGLFLLAFRLHGI